MLQYAKMEAMKYESENRICQNCRGDFIIEPEDFNFYEKMKVPPPTFCPLCRVQRRFSFRNERKLFKVKDAFTGKDIFSLYPPQSSRKVITQEEWHSDSWDPMEYARDYDFSRSFFEQFFELEKQIPVYNLNSKMMINSPYSGNASALKNCYLCFNSNYSEDCMYGNAIDFSKDCADNSHIKHSERCYESFWLQNCYQCYFSIMSSESTNLWFCRDCLGCTDCFGCVNLRKASHCIFNKQYSKEDYEKELEKMQLNTFSGIKNAYERTREFWKTQPVKYHQGLKNLNSTGSYVTNCKNVKNSYLVRESENMRYCQYMQVPGNKDCYDVNNWGEHTELSYETCVCGEYSYNLKFCFSCWPTCRDTEYSINLFSSSDCFGCVGLKKKQYCILNKQYTKEEYVKMIERIKKQMNEIPYVDIQGLIYKYGEFFPIELSPLGYNNTVVMQYFSLSKEEAKKKGYLWIEIERGEYVITKKASELLDSINDITDQILKEVIECNLCKKAYRVLENEFLFLKKEKLPLPRLCNDCRYERRISNRLKIQLYERSCMCTGETDSTKIYKNTVKHFYGDKLCAEKFKTGYKPNSEEIIYCERCYQQEVY